MAHQSACWPEAPFELLQLRQQLTSNTEGAIYQFSAESTQLSTTIKPLTQTNYTSHASVQKLAAITKTQPYKHPAMDHIY